MYICICNCIKDKQIDSCAADGVSDAGEVFARMGCKPVCGRCIPEIADNLQRRSDICVSE